MSLLPCVIKIRWKKWESSHIIPTAICISSRFVYLKVLKYRNMSRHIFAIFKLLILWKLINDVLLRCDDHKWKLFSTQHSAENWYMNKYNDSSVTLVHIQIFNCAANESHCASTFTSMSVKSLIKFIKAFNLTLDVSQTDYHLLTF
jgi:hypothetical protein